MGDATIKRPWSKHSEGSSAFKIKRTNLKIRNKN